MPPKKKRKSSAAPKEPEEPLEFVAHVRQKVRSVLLAVPSMISNRMFGRFEHGIEQNVREIRALLNINAEIFGRVMDSDSAN